MLGLMNEVIDTETTVDRHPKRLPQFYLIEIVSLAFVSQLLVIPAVL